MTQQNSISAAKFKAQCLKLMDQVQQSGQFITITKRGNPVVRLVPVHDEEQTQTAFGCMNGTANLASNIVIADTLSGESEQDMAFALLDSPTPDDKYSLVHYENVKSIKLQSKEVVPTIEKTVPKDEISVPPSHREPEPEKTASEENITNKEDVTSNSEQNFSKKTSGHVEMTTTEISVNSTTEPPKVGSQEEIEEDGTKKYALTSLDDGINWGDEDARKSMFPEEYEVIDTFDLRKGTAEEDLPPLPDMVQDFEEKNPGLIKKYSADGMLEKLQEAQKQAGREVEDAKNKEPNDDFPIPEPEDDPLAPPTEGGG